MKRLFLTGLLLLGSLSASAQLACTYGAKGLQTVSYNGATLEDMFAHPGDVFHIWHMVTEDLSGNVTPTSGEINNGTSWNASTNTETYTFSWGTLATQLICANGNINAVVTATNNAGSGVVFDGAEVYPYALHINPATFYGYSQFKHTAYGMGISVGDYGTGIATAVAPSPNASGADQPQPFYTGWKNVASQNSDSDAAFSPIMSTTLPDGANNFPPAAWKLKPGQTGTYTVSVRFTNEGTPANTADMASAYAAAYPYQVVWTNHGPINTVYFASSTGGATLGSDNNASNPAGCGASSANPRNYKNGDGTMSCNVSKINSTVFQDQILQDARNIVANTQAIGGQGVVFWDFEGEEFSQPVTYVGSPDQLPSLSPEMEQIVTTSTSANSAYSGMKLDDAVIAIVRAAGLTPGFCFRPNQFTLETASATDPNNSSVTLTAGQAVQAFPNSTAQATQWLQAKFAYVKARWDPNNQGLLAYIDSMVDSNGMPLSPDVLQQTNAAYPKILEMPESQNSGSSPSSSTPTTSTANVGVPLRYFAYSYPFGSFIFHTYIGTPSVLPGGSIYQTYPNAASAILINDVDATALSNFTPLLTTAVSKGDILMAHGDYDDEPNNTDVKNINTAAAYQPPASPPTSSVPQCPINSGHVCWYVRPDGGSRYDAQNNPTGLCDGLSDLPAAGAVNRHCAFNQFQWFYETGAYTTGSGSGGYGWIGQGGDTYFVRGSLQNGNTYRIGWANPSGAYDSATNLQYGIAGDPYNSYIPRPPSGSAGAPTRILGENYNSCRIQGARAQLHGGYGIYEVLDLSATSYVDVECFDITDFSNCGLFAQTSQCSTTVGSLTDHAKVGISFDNTENHDTVRNIRIHGMAAGGLAGPTGDGTVLDGVDLLGNAEGGWNADNGTVGVGSLLVENFNISWNGCAEEYPIVDTLPYGDCTDDNGGGYGDGFGTATIVATTPWNVTFYNGLASYNTQDGLDALHLIGAGSSMAISNVLAYGNMGQQLKTGGANGSMVNNIIFGNCRAMSGTIPGTPTSYNAHLSDFCRAADTSVVVSTGKNAKLTYIGNTLYSNNSTAILLVCDGQNGDCDSSSLVDIRNNVMFGFSNTDGEYPGQIYTDGFSAGVNVFTNVGSFNSHNATFRGKYGCPANSEVNALCGDPLLKTETMPAYGYVDPTPTSSSPLIGGGTPVSFTMDYSGAARSNPPDVGGLQSTSTFAPPSGSYSPGTFSLAPVFSLLMR